MIRSEANFKSEMKREDGFGNPFYIDEYEWKTESFLAQT
jgi:hypothetical protein